MSAPFGVDDWYKYYRNNLLIFNDKRKIFMWQTESFKDMMTWAEAVEECKNLRIGGYTDWRLPTIKELLSLVNYSLFNPATSMPNTIPSFYWSSTTSASNTGSAWGVNFSYGHDFSSDKDNSYYVRAVRGGEKCLCGK